MSIAGREVLEARDRWGVSEPRYNRKFARQAWWNHFASSLQRKRRNLYMRFRVYTGRTKE